MGLEDRLIPTRKGNITVLNLNLWEFFIVERGSQQEFLNYLRKDDLFSFLYNETSWRCPPAPSEMGVETSSAALGAQHWAGGNGAVSLQHT